jgi:hypothetical protein
MQQTAHAGVENAAANYDAVKEFEGRKYTGMRVGGSHSWYYRQGQWKETKVAPDKWQFTYAVNKRRKWNAPEGSGAPVGTEYHWFVLARQNVRKLSANEYKTSMMGTKYKLAHRRAAGGEWSASDRTQLRRLISIFEENIILLQRELGEESEMIGGRKMRPKSSSSNFRIRESPLETYMAP